MNFFSSLISLAPKRIAFLKFIIEGYDGLATVTTVDRSSGLVRLIYPVERKAELTCLVQELLPGIQETGDKSLTFSQISERH